MFGPDVNIVFSRSVLKLRNKVRILTNDEQHAERCISATYTLHTDLAIYYSTVLQDGQHVSELATCKAVLMSVETDAHVIEERGNPSQ